VRDPGPAALAALRELAGPGGYFDDPADLAPALRESRGLYQGSAPCLLAPDSTAAVAAILAHCHREGIGVVPQGGNTGLVGGAVPRSRPGRPEILLSTRRLNRIRGLDPDNHTVTAEAGCVLASLQAAAAAADRFFPLSLAAEGSCTLGGNIATNAGGTAVLRFGNTRDLVLGLEVVLPDGRILDVLRGLRKDNTGYDLKQLFIGAEGTLGIITAATCKLYPAPRGVATAFLAVPDPAAAIALHSMARSRLGSDLVAFEFMGRLPLEMVLRHLPGTRDPLDRPHPWYVLLEVAGPRPPEMAEQDLQAFLEGALAAELVADGVVAVSGSQRDGFWRLRHGMSEAQRFEGASIKHDIAVPVSRVGDFLERATATARALVPGVRVVAFGHLGDGNIHFNLSQPEGADREAFLARWEEVAGQVHAVAMDLGGSFSAEHGIGTLKTGELRRWRGGVELDLMRTLKQALDPAGIMNPGKLLGP
jgi:FAD/FMN-containing dehydrogenase